MRVPPLGPGGAGGRAVPGARPRPWPERAALAVRAQAGSRAGTPSGREKGGLGTGPGGEEAWLLQDEARSRGPGRAGRFGRAHRARGGTVAAAGPARPPPGAGPGPSARARPLGGGAAPRVARVEGYGCPVCAAYSVLLCSPWLPPHCGAVAGRARGRPGAATGSRGEGPPAEATEGGPAGPVASAEVVQSSKRSFFLTGSFYDLLSAIGALQIHHGVPRKRPGAVRSRHAT
ncbi:collagen alpha-1(I) chain-like [Mirounga leonina]|uniref:collagen alpha-1(I) chain-like n=1 Tax=Mirounga leonina TaxID=9715 RepID=UPI00156C183A|nr:collagen alpha-1(I) chain-like [Mirounga leonina]